MLDVCLLGTSGMLPLPGRWLTSLMTRYNGSSLLIDCGEGTQIAIKEKGWSFHPIDVICFTHYHADHISGLPGLLLTIGNSDRKDPVTLIGPKGLGRVVSALRVIAPELPYELKLIELSESQEHISIKGYEIDAFRVNHAVTCYGYSIQIPRIGKFDLEKAKSLGIPQKAWNKLQHGSVVEMDGAVYTPDMVMGKPRKGLKVTYCTDSRPVKAISDNAAG
ncbi:MAG: ribonuclease Z, partial [Eubacteriales bacterium]|nr:ribonuclease Z [Eubacteriales bacterium]